MDYRSQGFHLQFHLCKFRNDSVNRIACRFINVICKEESLFVRHAYFLSAHDPHNALKTTLEAEIKQKPGPPSTLTPPTFSQSRNPAASQSR